MEFTTWSVLGTYAGALAMVMILTQLTKNIAFIEKWPTQIWSYAVALITLLLAHAFTDGLSLQATALCVFNAAIVALGANGGFEAFERLIGSKKKE